MRRIVILSLAAGVLLSFGAGPGATGANWSRWTLSAAGADAVDPQLAVNATGDAAVVWRRFDGSHYRVQLRVRPAGGAWSTTQTLSGAGQDATEPRLAVDPNGNAVVVWTRSDGANTRIQLRARSAAGTLSLVQTLSAAGADANSPRLGLDADGDAVAIWRRWMSGEWELQDRARSAAGELSGVKTWWGRNYVDFEIAVLPGGSARVVYTIGDETTGPWGVASRTRSASGLLSTAHSLSPAEGSADSPRLAVRSTGDAVFVWRRYYWDRWQIESCAIVPSSAYSCKGLARISSSVYDSTEPQVAMNSFGRATFVWTQLDGAGFTIEERSRLLAGPPGPLHTLSAPDGNASQPQLAAGPEVGATFVWKRFDGSADRVRTLARSPDGALATAEDLSAVGENAKAPNVAVDSNGHTFAAWTRFDGTNWRVQAAAGF